MERPCTYRNMKNPKKSNKALPQNKIKTYKIQKSKKIK